jgi:hypothetical protein
MKVGDLITRHVRNLGSAPLRAYRSQSPEVVTKAYQNILQRLPVQHTEVENKRLVIKHPALFQAKRRDTQPSDAPHIHGAGRKKTRQKMRKMFCYSSLSIVPSTLMNSHENVSGFLPKQVPRLSNRVISERSTSLLLIASGVGI